MDEMNNVTMENETAMENTPVEVVPSSAVDVTYNDEHEGKSGTNAAMIIAGGVVAAGVVVGVAKWVGPKVKKGWDHLKEKVTKHKKSEDVEEVVEETSDEE